VAVVYCIWLMKSGPMCLLTMNIPFRVALHNIKQLNFVIVATLVCY